MVADRPTKPTDSTADQQHDGSQNQSLNLVNVAKPGDFAGLSNGTNTASQYLPHDLQIVDSSKTPKPADQPKPGEQPKPAVQVPAGEERHGATTVKNDDQGKAKEYANGEYTLSKHDDGKWFYHQNGDGHDFVEVKGDSIKMDDQGKVSYSESGMFGKDNQTLGNGSTGFLSSITSAASHVEDAVVNHPLDTFNSVAFMPLAAMDAITGTHAIKAIGEIEKGAADEVIHHPGEILRDVAIGAAIGALTVATGGGALVALGIGAAALATTELVKNDGNIGGIINDGKAFGNTVANWGSDIATVAGSGQHSQEEEAAAEQGLHQLGAFGAHTVAGMAGGVAGEVGATAAGLSGAIPRAATNIVSRLRPGESPPETTGIGGNLPTAPRINSDEIQNPPINGSPTHSYGDFVNELQSNGLSPNALADSVRPDNLLGEGYANKVYTLDQIDGYVARLPKAAAENPSTDAPLNAVHDYWPERNLGQPVAQAGDMQILKAVEGSAIKPAPEEGAGALERIKALLSKETPAQKFERQERVIAGMPQSSYDELAQTLRGLQARGKHFDAVNPGNILVSKHGFNPVDIGDEPIMMPGGAIDPRSAGFGLYEMIRPLMATKVNEIAPAAVARVQSSYQAIIEKSVEAAQRTGLDIVPDPRLFGLFQAAGIPERYGALMANRPINPGLHNILMKANYFGNARPA